MIIVICNSYPEFDRYRMSQEWSWKDCHGAYDKHTAIEALSMIASEIRIISIPNWIDIHDLFHLIRRLRIQR